MTWGRPGTQPERPPRAALNGRPGTRPEQTPAPAFDHQRLGPTPAPAAPADPIAVQAPAAPVGPNAVPAPAAPVGPNALPAEIVRADPNALPAFGPLRQGLPPTPPGAIRINAIVADEGHGGAIAITERALRTARTVTITGPHPLLIHAATSTGTAVHHEPLRGGSFIWARPYTLPSGRRQLHLGTHITGQGGDLRIYIATTITAPTVPTHLLHLTTAHIVLDDVPISYSIHGPTVAVGAAVLELVFTTPDAPPPVLTSGLAVAAGAPRDGCDSPNSKSAPPHDTPKRRAATEQAQPPTERRHRERAAGTKTRGGGMQDWAPSVENLQDKAPSANHQGWTPRAVDQQDWALVRLRHPGGPARVTSVGNFVVVTKLKAATATDDPGDSTRAHHLPEADSDYGIPPLEGDSDDDVPPLDGASDSDPPSLRSLSISSDPPSPRFTANNQDAVYTTNRNDINHDLTTLRSRINELAQLDPPDAYAEDAMSRIVVEGLLGPRRPRTTKLHPHAAPYDPAWHRDYALSPASVTRNPAGRVYTTNQPEHVTTYMDDTRTLHRDGKATGEPGRGRFLTARNHELARTETPTTIDVSGAYQKAKVAIG